MKNILKKILNNKKSKKVVKKKTKAVKKITKVKKPIKITKVKKVKNFTLKTPAISVSGSPITGTQASSKDQIPYFLK